MLEHHVVVLGGIEYSHLAFSRVWCISSAASLGVCFMWEILSTPHTTIQLNLVISVHPSQPHPNNYQDSRKHPVFPGAIPIDTNHDVEICINQTGQIAPSNALLGKPSQCKCKFGYTQAFSLDPMPSNKLYPGSKKLDRLNSGLLKLTCPLLVSSVDILEDDGFIFFLNSKLSVDGEEGNELRKCMNDAHKVHAKARSELIFGENDISKVNKSDNNFRLLQSKLGEQGAKSFMNAGVAGASVNSMDVKCLHAWLADYLMRGDDTSVEHPIGEAIVKALDKRGVDIAGTDTCNQVCSGQCSRSSSDNETISVQVPIPRNRQRKKRRQIQMNGR